MKGAWVWSLLPIAVSLCSAASGSGRPAVSGTESGIKDFGLKPYTRLSISLPHRGVKPWRLVCEMPYNCQFQPWIRLTGPAGVRVRLDSTNPLVRYLSPTETFVTQGGAQTYEAHAWISGEGALYTIPAGVTVQAVQYRETGVNTRFAGSFSCNDEDFNILWRKAARTAYLCMRDHFYDCPDRERVGFWGDGTPELDQCFYVFDRATDRLCKNLVLRKLEPKFYPGQHLEFLGEYGLWFYYMQTGDRESLSAVYESTKTFLLDTYKFGNRSTWFDWGSDSKDTSVIETCFEYIDLGALKKMALLTGHAADLPVINARRASIRSTFDARFWRGGFYQSADVQTPDDRANAMAVNAGLADPGKWDAIYNNVLRTTTNASCFFDRWVFEALCKMGREDEAMLRMVTRYRTMIESSFTTLWEHYDRWWASWLNAFDEGSSLNHGWNPPALVLSEDIAGVRPVAPGWSTYEVLPKEAFLTRIHVVVPSIKGPVTMSLNKSSTAFDLDLTSPAGATAIVGIPHRAFARLDSVYVNGALLWAGKFLHGAHGVAWGGDADGYLKFSAPPGRWHFSARGLLSIRRIKTPRPTPKRATALDKHGWTATASVPDGVFPFSGAKIPVDYSAANAIDGDAWTGWRDMTAPQHPGQWFQIDMRRRQTFDTIVLDNTWALWDSPHSYSVTVSDDGERWTPAIAAGNGHLGITTIRVPRQTARFIRITQTGSDPTYHWSIFEINVLRGTG